MGDKRTGVLIDGRPVEELTREELIAVVYDAYDQQERYLAEMRRGGKSMVAMMGAVAKRL